MWVQLKHQQFLIFLFCFSEWGGPLVKPVLKFSWENKQKKFRKTLNKRVIESDIAYQVVNIYPRPMCQMCSSHPNIPQSLNPFQRHL